MKHRHPMPFGSQPLEAGGVRFCLWAPSVPCVRLQIEGEQTASVAMQAHADGWHRLELATAAAGTRYRFVLPDGLRVPDTAARCNPDDVHGASEVIDALAFDWRDADLRGRPWSQAVIYELHVGSFSPGGDFAGVQARLDYLVALGVMAIELMPVADFPGQCNWGYDGVLLFAPDARYGRPDDLKRLVAATYARLLHSQRAVLAERKPRG